MIKVFVSGIVLVLAAIGLWGVGNLIRRMARLGEGTWPVSAGLGLAAIVSIGGVLNLAHVARPMVIWLLTLAGVVIGILELVRARPRLPTDSSARIELISAGLFIVLVTGFAIATQLPPTVFNSRDDFQKYFAHPVRMLETGTLVGSPVNDLGLHAIGGQAFLHGLVLSFLPIGYINGVDAVFAFFLLMTMAAAAGWRRFGKFPGALFGVAIIAVIHPQYVNVSALYVGALLMATATLALADDREKSLPAPLLIGLLYGAMVAIKPLFALFALLHLSSSLFAAQRALGSWKDALLWVSRAAGWAFISLAPWLLMYLPNYLTKGAFPREMPPDVITAPLNLFSTKPLFYGGSFVLYTTLAGLGALAGLGGIIAARRSPDARMARAALGLAGAAGVGVISYLVLVLVLGPKAVGYGPSVRYSVPTLLGTSVFAFLLLPGLKLPLPPAIPAVACLGIIAAFAPSGIARYQEAVDSGSILAYTGMATHPEYIRYNQVCLSPETAQRIRALQEKVPAGEPILVWIDTPFHIDFARNPIMDLTVNGLVNPWAHIPANVHYVLWQYRNLPGFEGFGVRGVNDYVTQRDKDPSRQEREFAALGLLFLNRVQQLANSGQVIANDGTIVLFRLPDATQPPAK
jgi:hypothetical protein